MLNGAIGQQLLVGGWLCIIATAADATAWPDYSVEREQYRQAQTALARGNRAEYQRLQRQLADYPLHGYLQHADLKRRLKRAQSSEVRAFLTSFEDLPISGRLRTSWLRQLGKRKRWTDYLLDYRASRSADLRCYWHRARLQRGQVADYNADTRDLWLTGKSQADACDPLFDHWRGSGQLDDAAYSQRAELAVKAGNPRLARYLSRGLPDWRRAEIQRWIDLRADRAKAFKQAPRWQDTEFHRVMLSHELGRVSRSDNEFATAQWLTLERRFSWLPEQRAKVEQNLALYYATDYPDDALARLQALPAPARSQQINEWTIRVAVRNGDWPMVDEAWRRLEAASRQKPRWRYWRARALAERGQIDAANSLFEALAAETNYYGFLAADRLNLPYTICPDSTALTATDTLVRQTGLVRAFELFRLGELANARREWNAALRGLTGADRVQAALLATREQWYNRAILTLADEGKLKFYEARFPLAWQPNFVAQAKAENLDLSLLQAVARSESALIPDAVSSAGARGLMQLTPATGRRVARSNKWRRPSNHDLLRPATSIKLGSAYLDQLFDRFEHPLKVLAAYNAGPHVVERWDSLSLPVDADRWVESLPYHETRDYVARVLAFATIYDWRRGGTMQRLSNRMPTMDSRNARFLPGPSSGVAPVCTPTTLASN